MSVQKLTGADVGVPKWSVGVRKKGSAFDLTSHERARKALEFGLGIQEQGYNLFVVGPDRSGRLTQTMARLKDYLQKKAPASDWVYLNNFKRPHEPEPYAFPAGTGEKFQQDMLRFIQRLEKGFFVALSNTAHQNRVKALENKLNKGFHDRLEEIRHEAMQQGLTIVKNEHGFEMQPINAKGDPTDLKSLSPQEQEALEKEAANIVEKLGHLHETFAKAGEQLEQKIENLRNQEAQKVLKRHHKPLVEHYAKVAGISLWLETLYVDILENRHLFTAHKISQEENADFEKLSLNRPIHNRYAVNVIVNNGDLEGVPLILESTPSYEKLFGRIEYKSVNGAMETDFSLIKGGALHRANGGVLVIRASSLLEHHDSFLALKSALKSQQIVIEERYREGSVPIAMTPSPKPVPLDIKIVLIGSSFWYYKVLQSDPEFMQEFKVKADIAPDMETTIRNVSCYTGLLREQTQKLGIKSLSSSAICELLCWSSRQTGDRRKLSASFESLFDIVLEARHLQKRNAVDGRAVRKAIDFRTYRKRFLPDRVQEQIKDQTVMIDVEGKAIGQVNGLTVRSYDDFSFGGPARITARTSVGRSGVLNIERSVGMGGPIQQKGAFILQGFLLGLLARHFPVSFNASITFEQSYGGVEGDSASLAELIAILSDLTGFAVHQGLAITGSVNQHGFAQAVGGVHLKIEGFFDTCKARGSLSKQQGVIIPHSNRHNLVLRADVVSAINQGQFHIWTVDHIDEAVALLFGKKAGRLDKEVGRMREGVFSKGSVYAKALEQVEAFNTILFKNGVQSENIML